MAVVKADAYGHGLLPVAHAAVRAGADWLGVAQFAEAFALRDAGMTTRLLTWLCVPGTDFAGAVRRTSTCPPPRRGRSMRLAAAAREQGRTARVHLKVDTGLGRGGAYGTDWPALLDHARLLEAEGVIIQVVGIWTHFAFADAPEHPTVLSQQDTFFEAVALARGRPPSRGPAPRELGGDARPPLGSRRPRPAGDRHLRPCRRSRRWRTTSTCDRS